MKSSRRRTILSIDYKVRSAVARGWVSLSFRPREPLADRSLAKPTLDGREEAGWFKDVGRF